MRNARRKIKSCLFIENQHLALFAIKLETESAAVGKGEIQLLCRDEPFFNTKLMCLWTLVEGTDVKLATETVAANHE